VHGIQGRAGLTIVAVGRHVHAATHDTIGTITVVVDVVSLVAHRPHGIVHLSDDAFTAVVETQVSVDAVSRIQSVFYVLTTQDTTGLEGVSPAGQLSVGELLLPTIHAATPAVLEVGVGAEVVAKGLIHEAITIVVELVANLSVGLALLELARATLGQAQALLPRLGVGDGAGNGKITAVFATPAASTLGPAVALATAIADEAVAVDVTRHGAAPLAPERRATNTSRAAAIAIVEALQTQHVGQGQAASRFGGSKTRSAGRGDAERLVGDQTTGDG
jgi:hypothetical protein